uniref:Small ribosomal subunit protein bS18c n=1 Tax=Caloglossa intermedia TaxID=100879 RepID=A0A1Z1M634_9FLOR|nr:ribosomal protein S18 [Caloglossa intermedia]ARW61456.1 ribosomal protein S18 [Caloglossa intermedia]
MNSSDKYNYFIKQGEMLDYKDIDTLKKYLNEQGKILSRRSTGLHTKKQKQVSRSIKKARILGLLPFLNRN